MSSLNVSQLRDLCNAQGMSCKDQNGGYLTKGAMVKKLQSGGSGSKRSQAPNIRYNFLPQEDIEAELFLEAGNDLNLSIGNIVGYEDLTGTNNHLEMVLYIQEPEAEIEFVVCQVDLNQVTGQVTTTLEVAATAADLVALNSHFHQYVRP